MRSHEWIDQRSLAFDEAVAEKLRSNPALVDRARATVERWIEGRQPAPPAVLLEWRDILGGPMPRIMELLISTDERARRLRQSSPFCGILTAQERIGILRKYESLRT